MSGVIRLEKLGKPTVFVATDNFATDAQLSAKDNEMPTVRIATVPAHDYYNKRVSLELVRPVAKAAFDSIVNTATRPLTGDEAKPKAEKKEENKLTEITANSYEDALEKFNRVFLDNHWSDGLPLVPPTPEAVKLMLTGTSRSPQEVIGKTAPRNGIATIEKIAINAVMAGAKPEYLPVIIAAMEGLTDKNYDLLHMMTSTGSFSLAIAVSGPIAKEIGMYSGIGLLGYGSRANNTIGRAVRLSLINIGEVWPGENDMALVGRASSHKFFTFAENQDYNPWEPYHVSQGFKPGDSCVTVSTVGGQVMSPGQKYGLGVYGGGSVRPWTPKEILDTVVKELGSYRPDIRLWKHGTAITSPPKLLLVTEPVFSMEAARRGETKNIIQKYIYDGTRIPYEKLTPEEITAIQRRIDTGEIPQSSVAMFKEALKPGGKVPLLDRPEDIHIIVAGGIPSYTFGMTYFSRPLYAPTAHQTKLIRGATLTKAGR